MAVFVINSIVWSKRGDHEVLAALALIGILYALVVTFRRHGDVRQKVVGGCLFWVGWCFVASYLCVGCSLIAHSGLIFERPDDGEIRILDAALLIALFPGATVVVCLLFREWAAIGNDLPHEDTPLR